MGSLTMDGLNRTGANIALQKNGKSAELLAALIHILPATN